VALDDGDPLAARLGQAAGGDLAGRPGAGSGYPDGLRGEQIPLGARVILVCDAYHAMTSDRPYRAALDSEEALR
jgi:hypothetical protein